MTDTFNYKQWDMESVLDMIFEERLSKGVSKRDAFISYLDHPVQSENSKAFILNPEDEEIVNSLLQYYKSLYEYRISNNTISELASAVSPNIYLGDYTEYITMINVIKLKMLFHAYSVSANLLIQAESEDFFKEKVVGLKLDLNNIMKVDEIKGRRLIQIPVCISDSSLGKNDPFNKTLDKCFVDALYSPHTPTLTLEDFKDLINSTLVIEFYLYETLETGKGIKASIVHSPIEIVNTYEEIAEWLFANYIKIKEEYDLTEQEEKWLINIADYFTEYPIKITCVNNKILTIYNELFKYRKVLSKTYSKHKNLKGRIKSYNELVGEVIREDGLLRPGEFINITPGTINIAQNNASILDTTLSDNEVPYMRHKTNLPKNPAQEDMYTTFRIEGDFTQTSHMQNPFSNTSAVYQLGCVEGFEEQYVVIRIFTEQGGRSMEIVAHIPYCALFPNILGRNEICEETEIGSVLLKGKVIIAPGEENNSMCQGYVRLYDDYMNGMEHVLRTSSRLDENTKKAKIKNIEQELNFKRILNCTNKGLGKIKPYISPKNKITLVGNFKNIAFYQIVVKSFLDSIAFIPVRAVENYNHIYVKEFYNIEFINKLNSSLVLNLSQVTQWERNNGKSY